MRFFVVEIPMKMTDAGEGLEGRRDVLVPALNLPVQSEKTPASVRAPRRFPQGGCTLALCLVRRPRAHLTRLAAEALFAAARAELEVVDAATPVRTSVSVCVPLDHKIDLRSA